MRRRTTVHTNPVLPLHSGPGGTPVPGHATPLRRKRKKKRRYNKLFGGIILFCGSFLFMFAAVFGILHHNSPELQKHVKTHVDRFRNKAHRAAGEFKKRRKGEGRKFRPEDLGKRPNQKMPRPYTHPTHTETITCPDGTRGLVNDDYCDCSDGSDEPDTAACAGRLIQKETFKCKDGSKTIYASRVGDGIVDCEDGSDEPEKKFLHQKNQE